MPVILQSVPAPDHLTTLPKLKQHIGVPAEDTTNDLKYLALIGAASRAIEKYCDRLFISDARSEVVYSGENGYVSLSAYPITAITRVATPDYGLTIINASTDNQISTATVSSTTILLTATAAGVVSSNTLTLASYTTVQALCTAITAIGNGWVATPRADYSNHPAVNLIAGQHVLDATSVTDLMIWGKSMSRVNVDHETGTVWGRFRDKMRFDYTGGYSPLPDDLQLAVTVLAKGLYQMSIREAAIKSERIGDYSYTLQDATALSAALPSISPDAAMILAPYRRVRAL